MRAFLAGSANTAGWRGVFAHVSEAWDALTDAEKSKILRRGGKNELAQAIHKTMPHHVPLTSVERELRRVRGLQSKPEN